MGIIDFTVLPPVGTLCNDVDSFRIARYGGEEALSIKVCPHGFPGIVFQQNNGQSAIKDINTKSGRVIDIPTLYIHGQVKELAIMNFKQGPFVTIQVVLKPHALRTLFGMDVSTLTNNSFGFAEIGMEDLNRQLLDAKDNKHYIKLLTDFLMEKQSQGYPRDTLVEQSLCLINKNISFVTVKYLIEQLHISERQFEKRFVQCVGITPQAFIRIKRVNEAIKLMDTDRYERLSDIARALNYYDQSHFIRDIKEFSGITPKSISQKVNSFHHDHISSSYLV
ncbi:AraC-like DNA-binding protein [Bacillus oleivorans]|uniref:AraC-like DNA-binding protein n=1 Tax=Bacillus oleivorans TaxID=1448271 RepID=A0A285D7Z1_9BACI|nr:helix-turn-helix domain-containing protein [Bacillus oleivorans]SNX75398.1 AraC-like DNA-binding protein [Bacillus oleivorans]